MKIFKDKKIIILAVILVVFTICYFAIANKISYAFSQNYNLESTYNSLLETIEKSAKYYAKGNPELFQVENTIYIKVQDLIDNKILITNEEGKIINPLNNESMNTNIIKIKQENSEYLIEINN